MSSARSTVSSPDLLRSHVAQGTDDRAGFVNDSVRVSGSTSPGRPGPQSGDPEVEDLDLAGRRHEHVFGLDVPVDDPFAVRRRANRWRRRCRFRASSKAAACPLDSTRRSLPSRSSVTA